VLLPRIRCTIAFAVEMKFLPGLVTLAFALATAACGSSSGPAGDIISSDAQPPLTQRAADGPSALKGMAEDASPAADAPVPDAAEPADVPPAEDRPRRFSDGGRALDGGGRETSHPRTCMAGATCGPNAHCERPCMGQEVYRCTCTEGYFVCTGCISVDGGVPDTGGAGFCAGNVSVQGRRCDHAGDVCHYSVDAGQRLCACGDVGPQRLWICQ
jgi:hypothetical protein